MRIGMIGYGAVAAVHAKGLRRRGADLHCVCGPRKEKASAFASANGVPNSTTDLETLFEESEAVIVASPSDCHFAQAQAAVRAGRHCLVELPACSSAIQAEELRSDSAEANVVLQCAHTTRFLPAIGRVARYLKDGALGQLHHVISFRAIPPRSRSWVDDAVLHHAAHHVDLMLHWFGPLQPLSCAAHPEHGHAQDAALSGRLENRAPMSICVSYTSRLRETRLTIVGSRHTVITDGFSFIESDDPGLAWRGDEQDSYETAIETQDRGFVQACVGGDGGVAWQDTLRLAECLDRFLALSDSGRAVG